MRSAAVLLLCLLAAGTAWADEPVSAADVTEPGRSLDRALDVVLGPTADAAGKRTIYLLVDPTPSLKAAGFEAALERALARALPGDGKTSVAVAVVGDRKHPRLGLTKDPAAVRAAVRDVLAKPTDGFRNVYADVRRVAGLLAKRTGARDLVLVTLENGDGEDDVEGTAGTLERLRVRASCITREAFLADSFYVSSTRQVPRGLQPGAGDAPYVTLPWGWLFQQTIANETTPSGYAQYGLTRLAAASGGRVFLYAAPAGVHHCAVYGSCPFCSDDHQPGDESFQAHRVRALAPSARSRGKAGATLARDPWFRATLEAWTAASKEGFLRSRPSVRLAAGGVKPERRQGGSWATLLGSPSGIGRHAAKADKLRAACDRTIAALAADLARIDPQDGSPRHRAMAELTRVMLHVTRANLVAYAAWCREVAPRLLGKQEHPIEPPEISPLVEGRRVSGISYTPLCLCHGVAPFRALRLPGGAAWQAELDRLDEVFAAFMRRYAHTPYAIALRHQGLARFTFTYRGKTVTPPPRPKTGSTTETPTTETGRPNRGGSTTGGSGSSGATTGGG